MEKDEFIERLMGLLDVYGNVGLRKGDVQPPIPEKKFEAKKILTDEDEEGWYTNGIGTISIHKHDTKRSFGISGMAVINNTWLYNGCNGLWNKATDEEVLNTFTTYFRSQGFKEGSKFKDAKEDIARTHNEPLLLTETGVCTNDGMGRLFYVPDLVLATLIEDEKIMIGGEEVVFILNVSNPVVKINGVNFSIYEIEALSPSNPELFQKILDRLKSK